MTTKWYPPEVEPEPGRETLCECDSRYFAGKVRKWVVRNIRYKPDRKYTIVPGSHTKYIKRWCYIDELTNQGG